jgi:hypothetical protein
MDRGRLNPGAHADVSESVMVAVSLALPRCQQAGRFVQLTVWAGGRAKPLSMPTLRKRAAQRIWPDLVVGVRHLRGPGALRRASVQELQDS